MNVLERLFERIGSIPWACQSADYAVSDEEFEGVRRWLVVMSELARHSAREDVPHVLSSPARLLGYVPDEHTTKRIYDLLAQIPNNYAAIFVKNALELADMSTQGELPSGFDSDIFEPILNLIANGCLFYISKGYLQVGGNMIPLHRWPVVGGIS